MSTAVQRILFYLFAAGLLVAAMQWPEYKHAFYFVLFLSTVGFFVFQRKR